MNLPFLGCQIRVAARWWGGLLREFGDVVSPHNPLRCDIPELRPRFETCLEQTIRNTSLHSTGESLHISKDHFEDQILTAACEGSDISPQILPKKTFLTLYPYGRVEGKTDYAAIPKVIYSPTRNGCTQSDMAAIGAIRNRCKSFAEWFCKRFMAGDDVFNPFVPDDIFSGADDQDPFVQGVVRGWLNYSPQQPPSVRLNREDLSAIAAGDEAALIFRSLDHYFSIQNVLPTAEEMASMRIYQSLDEFEDAFEIST